VQVGSPVAGNSPQTVNVSFVVAAAVPATVIVTPGYAAIRTTAPAQTIQLSDTVKESGGALLPSSLATWTSRSPSIASVSASGLVTGLSAGSAVIVAQAGSAGDSMIVTVGNAAAAPGDMLIAAVTNNRAFGSRRVGQSVAVDIRVDQLAMISHEPSHAEFSAGLLVRVRDEDDVAREPPADVDHMSFEQQHGLEIRREHSLVIDRPAAIEVPTDRLAPERVDRPVGTFDPHDVHVSHDDHGPAGAVSREPCNERRSTRRRLEQTRFDPLGFQDAVQVLRHGDLVAWRIHRIDSDHALQVDDGLASDRSPIDRLHFRGHGSGCHVRAERGRSETPSTRCVVRA